MPCGNYRERLLSVIEARLFTHDRDDEGAYLGSMNGPFREGVETALCAMIADAVDSDAAKNVVPGSGAPGGFVAKCRLPHSGDARGLNLAGRRALGQRKEPPVRRALPGLAGRAEIR